LINALIVEKIIYLLSYTIIWGFLEVMFVMSVLRKERKNMTQLYLKKIQKNIGKKLLNMERSLNQMATRNEIIYWKRVSNLVDMIDKIDEKDEVYREMWKDKLRDLMLTKLPKIPTDENPIKPLKH